ncbi:MAG: glutathione S-transferase N-terminal domain-containing protein [Lysobacterales bacterium]
MKLMYSPTSPYARKVRALLIEKQIPDVELLVVNPLGETGALQQHNPLGKVPTLLLDDAGVIVDSPVICEYLDQLDSDAAALLPADTVARFGALTRQALADGIMDAAFALVMEARRPPQLRSEEWIARWQAAIGRTLDHFEGLPRPATRFDLGDLALAVALGYLDFRLPHLAWRTGRDQLGQWNSTVSIRPALAQTAPPQA